MQFNVILNRKGEKILKIEGYNEANIYGDLYGVEDDGNREDKTMFVNLNRLVKNQGGDDQS